MLVGNLKNYSFTISYSGGKITNNIKCSVVARGLAAALESSAEAAQLIREGNLTIRMDKNFCLWISRPETAKDLLLDFGP
jgi:hypothetical protein